MWVGLAWCIICMNGCSLEGLWRQWWLLQGGFILPVTWRQPLEYLVAFILSVCLDILCPHVPMSLSVLHRGNNKAHTTIVNQRTYLQTCDCILHQEGWGRWPWLHKTRWESLQDELARKQAVKWGHLRKTMEAFLPPPCIPVKDSLTTSEHSQSRCVVAWIKSVRKDWHTVSARLGFS